MRTENECPLSQRDDESFCCYILHHCHTEEILFLFGTEFQCGRENEEIWKELHLFNEGDIPKQSLCNHQ